MSFNKIYQVALMISRKVHFGVIFFLVIILMATVASGLTFLETELILPSGARYQQGVISDISGDGATVAVVAGNRPYQRLYIFEREGSTWNEQAIIHATSSGSFAEYDNLCSVSISRDGDTVALGHENHDLECWEDINCIYRSVYVYQRNGTSWTRQAELTVSDVTGSYQFPYHTEFGSSVSISENGNTIIIGAYQDCSVDFVAGSAFIFVRNGSSWTRQAKLIASDAVQVLGGWLGYSVDLSADGNTAILGSPGDDNFGYICGSTYIFQRSGSSWIQQAKLIPGDGATGWFGEAVAISDDGNIVIIGNPSDDFAGNNFGSAYIFQRSGSSWIQQTKLMASDAMSRDRFGAFVSISENGDTVIISSQFNDGASPTDANCNSGAVYIFGRNGTSWTQEAYETKLTASNASCGGHFGGTVSIGGHKRFPNISALREWYTLLVKRHVYKLQPLSAYPEAIELEEAFDEEKVQLSKRAVEKYDWEKWQRYLHICFEPPVIPDPEQPDRQPGPRRCPPPPGCPDCLPTLSADWQQEKNPAHLTDIFRTVFDLLGPSEDYEASQKLVNQLAKLLEQAPIGLIYTKNLKSEVLKSLDKFSSEKYNTRILSGKLIEALNALDLDWRIPSLKDKDIVAEKYVSANFQGVAWVAFRSVDKPGKATLRVKGDLPASVRGFRSGWPVASYVFDFTGGLSMDGYMDVSFYCGGVSFNGPLSTLRIFEWNGKVYKDITTHVDSKRGIITGRTNRLSTFVLMNPIPDS